MELRHLRYFAVAAELQHFRLAAARLHVAQPALSRQIRDLESELGVALFERLPRGVRLSAAGRVFLADVQRLLADVALAATRARSTGRGLAGRLRLGFVESASWSGVFPDSLHAFRKAYPNVILDIEPMRSGQAPDAVRSGRVEAAFAYFVPPDDDLARLTVATDDVVLAVPAKHPLARRRAPTLADCRDEPFVAFRRESAPEYHDLVVENCARGGFTPHVVQYAVNEAALLSLVSAGIGIAVVTSAIRSRRPENVVLMRARGLSIPLALALIWRPREVSPPLANYLAIVRPSARDVRNRD